LVAVLLLCGPGLRAADKPEPSEHLKPLAFLVGTWQSSGEFPGVGKYTDEMVYEWAMDKNFLKSTYTMKSADGKVAWTDVSMIGWDPEQKKLVGFTFGMDGSIGRGVELPSKKEGTWVFEAKGTNAEFKESRSTLSKVDDDTVSMLIETKKDGKYE